MPRRRRFESGPRNQIAMRKTKPKSFHVYKPEYCERIIELGRQGASQKMMWAELGIGHNTGMQWMTDHAEFNDAVDRALTLAQAYWEREMLANTDNKAFNARLVEIALRGQFPKDYKATTTTEVKTKVDAEVKIDFAGEINKLIDSLKAVDAK